MFSFITWLYTLLHKFISPLNLQKKQTTKKCRHVWMLWRQIINYYGKMNELYLIFFIVWTCLCQIGRNNEGKKKKFNWLKRNNFSWKKQCRQNLAVVILIYGSLVTVFAECHEFRGLIYNIFQIKSQLHNYWLISFSCSPFLFTKPLLTRYKNALEKSLKISTVHNISPIPGKTVIIVDIDEESSLAILTKSISPVKRNVS